MKLLFFVPTGVTAGGIGLAILEFCTVILFAIGGYSYFRLTLVNSTRKAGVLALVGTISCFVGGFPNACDKLSWAIFSYDLWFNSVWMFFFVGIGYVLLFVSALQLVPKKKREQKIQISIFAVLLLLSFAVPSFHKPMKYLTMLMSAVGMIGFYVILYIFGKKVIGKKALLFFVTMGMTLFLVVFSAAGKFDALWPNMLAQTCNNLGYLCLIIGCRSWSRAITTVK